MRLSRTSVSIAAMLVSAMVMVGVTCIGEVPESAEVAEPVEAAAEPEEAAEPETVPELIEEEVTSGDVHKVLLDQFEEGWPEKAKRQTLDLSLVLFRMGENYEVDPTILADEYMELLRTTLAMQPNFEKGWDGGVRRAMLVTSDIYRGARESASRTCHEIDPQRFDEDMDEFDVEAVNAYVLLSIGYRESRFTKRVETGEKLGGAGERGMFQFKPHKSGRRGFIEARFMPRYKGRDRTPANRCSPFDRMCAVRGAANALAWIRCECIRQFGERCNIDTYVAGYGRRSLPDPAEARHDRGPRNARRYLCDVRDDCDELWPVDHSDDFAATL